MSLGVEPPAIGSRVVLTCWPYGAGQVLAVDGTQALVQLEEYPFDVKPIPFNCLKAEEDNHEDRS
jgi:hypothetical protein